MWVLPDDRTVRFRLLVVLAGLVGAVAMVLSTTSTLATSVAAVRGLGGGAAEERLVLQEGLTGGSTRCSSTTTALGTTTSTCATIDQFGGALLVPSGPDGATGAVETAVWFRNAGTSAASSFSVGLGRCVQSAPAAPHSSATDLCAKLIATISSGERVLTRTSLASGATLSLPADLVPPARATAAIPFVVRVHLDDSADNSYQGLSASAPITWTLSS